MTLSVVFRRQARREFDEAGDWYEKERAGLGLEFLIEIERLLNRIAATPNQFPIVYRDMRKAVARRFPYCIYFRERDRRIIVLAVFHSARNPAVWQGRK
jgi:plasmid stabilization system protein ParE